MASTNKIGIKVVIGFNDEIAGINCIIVKKTKYILTNFESCSNKLRKMKKYQVYLDVLIRLFGYLKCELNSSSFDLNSRCCSTFFLLLQNKNRLTLKIFFLKETSSVGGVSLWLLLLL